MTGARTLAILAGLLLALPTTAQGCEGDSPKPTPSPTTACKLRFKMPKISHLPDAGTVENRKRCGKSRWLRVDGDWGKVGKSTYNACNVGDRWPDCKKEAQR